MKAIINHISKNLPLYISLALIVANTLIDQGVLKLPVNLTLLIDAVLQAAGFSVLHVRQQNASK